MPRNRPDHPPEQAPKPSSSFWRDAAAASALPCFPISIHWDPVKQKWIKSPLTAHGHLDATTDVDSFGDLWECSNGYGARMGNGLYGLDLDFSKPGCKAEEWFDRFGVSRDTRTHETISGGLHRIYRVPPEQGELRSRQGIVHGLDGRGGTGWLAFGACLGAAYTLLDDSEPAWLPEGACASIGGEGVSAGKVELGPLGDVDPAAVMARLEFRLLLNRKLRGRWVDGILPERDKSLSAMDHSTAKLLAIARMTEAEIVWLLANEFAFGVVRRDGLNPVTERAIRRSAWVVSREVEGEQAALDEALNLKVEMSPEDIAAMETALFGKPL